MAATKKFKPKRITSAEQRNAGRGQFVRLKNVNDQFLGYALFKPDPELDDNPGWYEFEQHYTPATGYVACFGEDCPVCEMGDNPSSRGIGAFLVVPKEDSDPETEGEVKLFEMNFYVVQEFVDYESDDGVQGRLFRIKRQEGQGKYAIRMKKDKITQKQVKAVIGADDFPEIEKGIVKRMAAVAEELDVTEAMEADEDEEEKDEKPTKARKGKEKPEEDDEPETVDGEVTAEFDPEEDTEAEDLTVTVVKVQKKNNIATVEHGDNTFDLYGTDDVDLTGYSKGDEIVVSFEKDEDDDFVVSEVAAAEAEPEDEPEEEGGTNNAPEGFTEDNIDADVTVVSVNSSEDTLTVETEDGEQFDLYFLDEGKDSEDNDWSDFDIDDYSEGDKIHVVASRDEDNDMLADAFPVKADEKKAAKKKSGGKKKAKA